MKTNTCYILGISAFYHDSSLVLLADGQLVFAAQEERYSRIKADPSFPSQALQDCLLQYNIEITDIDYIIFYENPAKKYQRIIQNCAKDIPTSLYSFINGVCPWAKGKADQDKIIKNEIIKALSLSNLVEIPPIFCTDHHLSHAASAFYPSPYSEAAIICIDGVGEEDTTSFWYGKDNKIVKHSSIKYPNSLGLLYSAFTQYTGFKVNSGEYKLMGLSPYGKPIYKQVILDKLLFVHDDGSYSVNMKYFSYQNGKRMINSHFEKLFGHKSRQAESDISQHQMDIASSIQAVFNEIILKLANKVYSEFKVPNLCLAGGVALNCVANGYIARNGPFDNIWIQPAAGDSGGAVGAAYLMWYSYLNHRRNNSDCKDLMSGCYLGPSYTSNQISDYLNSINAHYHRYSNAEITKKVAKLLSIGNVVGWFQGRMEFGPRALGNRSILGDPRSAKMQTTMNLKIKYRESFRPFAPSVLEEHALDYFELNFASPYMLFVNPVSKKYHVKSNNDHNQLTGLALLSTPRSTVPAITHVDHSARIQTVNKSTNPIYYQLINEFYAITGCPLVVNTSFNVRGEPIVRSPQNAYSCFMNTEMDYCVIGNYLLSKVEQPIENKGSAEFELD